MARCAVCTASVRGRRSKRLAVSRGGQIQMTPPIFLLVCQRRPHKSGQRGSVITASVGGSVVRATTQARASGPNLQGLLSTRPAAAKGRSIKGGPRRVLSARTVGYLGLHLIVRRSRSASLAFSTLFFITRTEVVVLHVTTSGVASKILAICRVLTQTAFAEAKEERVREGRRTTAISRDAARRHLLVAAQTLFCGGRAVIATSAIGMPRAA